MSIIVEITPNLTDAQRAGAMQAGRDKREELDSLPFDECPMMTSAPIEWFGTPLGGELSIAWSIGFFEKDAADA